MCITFEGWNQKLYNFQGLQNEMLNLENVRESIVGKHFLFVSQNDSSTQHIDHSCSKMLLSASLRQKIIHEVDVLDSWKYIKSITILRQNAETSIQLLRKKFLTIDIQTTLH